MHPVFCELWRRIADAKAFLPRLLFLACGALFAACLTAFSVIALEDPTPAIVWLSLSGIFGLLSLWAVEEILAVSSGWRAIITGLAGVGIVAFMWIGVRYVVEKSESRAWNSMVLAAAESRAAMAESRAVMTSRSEPKSVEPNSGPPIINVQIKYSSTQIVELSNASDENDDINLDNVATLVRVQPSNREQTGLALVSTPPLRIENPKGTITGKAGPGTTFQFQPADPRSGIETKSLRVMSGKKFEFDRSMNRSHVITVDKRRFRVTLLDINDRSKDKALLIQYTFGIREE